MDLQTLFELLDEVEELIDTLKVQAREEKDQDFYDSLGSADAHLDRAINELEQWKK